MDDEKDFEKLYEELLKRQETERKWQKEIDDERKFNAWFWVIFAVVFGLILIAAKGDNSYDGGCDPGIGLCEGP